MIYLKRVIISMFILLTGVFHASGVRADEWQIDIESGMVSSGYNDVKIPRETGTEISLTDDLETDSKVYYRLRLSLLKGERHYFSALFAPLELNASGSVNKIVTFEGVDFPANTALEAKYKFNSYRLTYRYGIINKPKLKIGFGFTGKIRDARVLVESPTLSSEKTNVGFVPLLSFSLLYMPSGKFSFSLDGDALAAPQGRAEDVLAAVRYAINDNIQFRVGYRILEGGADVDEVYNFALLHYLAAGITYSI